MPEVQTCFSYTKSTQRKKRRQLLEQGCEIVKEYEGREEFGGFWIDYYDPKEAQAGEETAGTEPEVEEEDTGLSPNDRRANDCSEKAVESSSILPDDEAEDYQRPYIERWGLKLKQAGFRMVPNHLGRLVTSKGWTSRDGPRNALGLYLMLEMLISLSEPDGEHLVVRKSNNELAALLGIPRRTVHRRKAQLEKYGLVHLSDRAGGRQTGTIDLTPLRERLLQMVKG